MTHIKDPTVYYLHIQQIPLTIKERFSIIQFIVLVCSPTCQVRVILHAISSFQLQQQIQSAE